MISVIIPVYNNERFVEQAVMSVLVQSYSNYEVVIVNDGSTDRTDEICRKMADQYRQIHYHSKENTGVSDTRNFGIKQSCGEYICFLDSDDILPKESLSVLIQEMEKNPSCDAVFGNYQYDYAGKYVPKVLRLSPGVYDYNKLRDRILDDGTLTGILFGSVCAALYRKDVMTRNTLLFDRALQVNEDGLFNIEFIRHANQIRVINDFVYLYRQWKSGKGKPLTADVRFEQAGFGFQNYFEKTGELTAFQKQLSRREVSMAFWNGIRVKDAETNLFAARKYLRGIFDTQAVKNGLLHMDYTHMNLYKRCLCFMMEHHLYTLFYFTIRYLYPCMEKLLKR